MDSKRKTWLVLPLLLALVVGWLCNVCVSARTGAGVDTVSAGVNRNASNRRLGHRATQLVMNKQEEGWNSSTTTTKNEGNNNSNSSSNSSSNDTSIVGNDNPKEEEQNNSNELDVVELIVSTVIGLGCFLLMIFLMSACLWTGQMYTDPDHQLHRNNNNNDHDVDEEEVKRRTSVQGRARLRHMSQAERLQVISAGALFRKTTFLWTAAAVTAQDDHHEQQQQPGQYNEENEKAVHCSDDGRPSNHNDNDEAQGVEIRLVVDTSRTASVVDEVVEEVTINQQNSSITNECIPHTTVENDSGENDNDVEEDGGSTSAPTNICCICLLEYTEGDRVMYGQACRRHYFHVDCCVAWLAHHDRCPYCHRDMMTPTDLIRAAATVLGKDRVKELQRLDRYRVVPATTPPNNRRRRRRRPGVEDEDIRPDVVADEIEQQETVEPHDDETDDCQVPDIPQCNTFETAETGDTHE